MAGKKGDFSRNQSSRNIKKYILLFREGSNSEPTYIKKLMPFKEDISIYKKVSLKNEGIGEKVMPYLVKCARTFSNVNSKDCDDIIGIWFAFDDDTRKDLPQALSALNSPKFSKANFDGKPLYIAYSSMTIEYWVLLHFRDHNGTAIYQSSDTDHSTRIIDLINREIDKYGLPHYDKSNDWVDDNFWFFTAVNQVNPLKFSTPKPRIVEAVVRAKRLHDQKIASGNEYAESMTTFYKLLEYLGVVKYTFEDNGQNYNICVDRNDYYYIKDKQKILVNYSQIWDSAYLNEKK